MCYIILFPNKLYAKTATVKAIYLNSFRIGNWCSQEWKTFIKGYGSINKDKSILPDSLSIFELASTSKLFTTATLQLLVDQGQLKLDDKIQTILTAKVKVSPLSENTTVLHLATHLT